MRQEHDRDGRTVAHGVLLVFLIPEMIGARAHVLFDDIVVAEEFADFLTEVAT